MIDEPMPPFMGKLIVELRDDADVAAITDRIRSPRPAPGDSGWSADAEGRRTYKHAFVVLVHNGGGRLPGMRTVPVRTERVVARCYGRDSTEAELLYLACTRALHGVGPRTFASGLAIYQSFEDSGPDVELDPDTQQPHYDFVIETLASTQAVA
jgi:hypothetical protein